MERRHTPGPWKKDEKGVLRGSNCLRVVDTDNDERITVEVHARVMADRALRDAAPELLEVARRWIALGDGPHALRIATHDAIAKAEGRA